MTLLDRVKTTLPALAPAERRVGLLVLDDPRAFATLPVKTLAGRAGVSNPTVVRFCRALGYGGLSEFKLKLAGHIGEGVPFVHRSVNANDSAGELVVKVVDNAVRALLDYRNTAAHANVEPAIDALARTIQARGRIEFYGAGNSGIVAQDAQHKFFRLGGNVVAYADGHLMLMGATMLGPRDCAVVISNSGRTRDSIEAAEAARRHGATLIVITASGSPLAGTGGLLLPADHSENTERYSPMVSRLLHLVIIDALATGTALRLGPKLPPKLAEIKKTLRQKRYR